jgi:5-formaminoimidazole-4-carboxamide-1-beta-D-ribofuranosyl 5'-monophosphate synthetase
MLNGFNSQYKGNIESIINNHIESRYDLNDVSVGVIGSHSALEIMDGAKEENP